MCVGLCELANVERSNLYLKLFKLVFGSVSLLANENEQMLKVSCRLNVVNTVYIIYSFVNILEIFSHYFSTVNYILKRYFTNKKSLMLFLEIVG